MTDMFGEFAKFGMANEPLKVNEVFHKALIEINEEGVEAAAFTGKLSVIPVLPYFRQCVINFFLFLTIFFIELEMLPLHMEDYMDTSQKVS